MPDDTDQPDDNLPSGTILPPADRHSINRLTRRTPAADLTTLIPPGLNIAGDLAANRAKRDGGRYTVNNRTCQRHENGRLFPLQDERLVGLVTWGVMHALNAFATGLNERAEYEISRTPIYLRKTQVTDISFGREPDIAALADATAKSYGVCSSSVVSGWFPGDTVHRAYRAPDVSVFWMKNYDQPGAFPLEQQLEVENGDPGQEAHGERLARITGALGIPAVMLMQFGRMHLLGPDGSDRIVSWEEDPDDSDAIRLSAYDRELLARLRPHPTRPL